ncbi:uncharacterized protein BYT42DRAFT_477000, partial [Radiomyces spectabilis]|uniref:uncharacterized protein n=1 Tax=Radiomyces spectabilis TaxID=64574 RepID=UPI00221EF11E
ALSVDKVRQLARILPEIRHMNFRYCTLTMDKAGPSEDTDDDNLCFTKVTHLSLFWTDFSDKSISELLRGLPHLQTVDLGANHNKVPRANDTALEALRANCPLVTHLSVALQQVKEQTLCEAIMQYGHQLKSLSIRCDSVQSLRTVAAHATHVEKLKVSAAGNDQEDEGAVIGVLRQCHRLVRLEMVCWMIQDVPGIV